MSLTDCYVGAVNMPVSSLKEGIASQDSSTISSFSQLGALAALCNAAEIDAAQVDVPIEQRNVFGDATDTAVLRFSESLAQGNVSYFRACWHRVFELAFNSKNKFMIRCFSITRREALEPTLRGEAAETFGDRDLWGLTPCVPPWTIR